MHQTTPDVPWGTISADHGDIVYTPTPAQKPRGVARRREAVQAAPRTEGVLLVAPAQRAPQLRTLARRLVADGWPGDVAECHNGADLRSALQGRRQRILVIHVELAERLDCETLAHLRQDHPNLEWFLVWHGNAPDLIELAIRTRARGGLDLAHAAQATMALEQVAAGHFWLPRWVLHGLYVALLDERRVLELGGAPPQPPSGPPLTHREAEVLNMLHEGRTNREIGERLGISVSTVKKHLKNAFAKRGLHSRRQARA